MIKDYKGLSGTSFLVIYIPISSCYSCFCSYHDKPLLIPFPIHSVSRVSIPLHCTFFYFHLLSLLVFFHYLVTICDNTRFPLFPSPNKNNIVPTEGGVVWTTIHYSLMISWIHLKIFPNEWLLKSCNKVILFLNNGW